MFFTIAHFIVTDENEAGVDLVLTQSFLLYYVNHVVLIPTSILLTIIPMRKEKRFVSKQGQPRPHTQSKAKILSPQL